MSAPVRRCALAVLVALAAGAAAAQQPGTARILAAIVRQDGAVVPFAEYRGGAWSAPGEIVEHAAPWFLAGGAAPSTWYFQPVEGTLETLPTEAPTKLASHCQTYWGLASSLAGRAVPRNTAHLNLGVATSGVRDLERPVTLLPTDAEVLGVRAWVQSQFDNAETVALREELSPQRAVAPARRGEIPLAFEKIIRSRRRISGRHVFYIEAARTYRDLAQPSDPGCAPVSVLRAWLAEDAAGRVTALESPSASPTAIGRTTTH